MLEICEGKLKQLTLDYKVLESTQRMYERNFNDEVALRLKFEEKINQTYCCYEQLKMKYDCLV